MNDPTLHLRAETLIVLKQLGMPADLLLRLAVHLKHLCPICALEVERFARMSPTVESWRPKPDSIQPEASGLAQRAKEDLLELGDDEPESVVVPRGAERAN